MRALLQRVKEAWVCAGGEEISRTGPGLCLFLGIAKGDTPACADYLAQKIVGLRIFEDETGKFNRSVLEVQGEILVVSQFTLYGDCAKGRRPSFSEAAPSGEAEEIYEYFVQKVREQGVAAATGKFQAKMEVGLINDGPVTLIVEGR